MAKNQIGDGTKAAASNEVGGVPAVKQSAFLALRDNAAAMMEDLAANLGGAGLTEADLKRVRIPGGGGVTWEIPGLVPEQAQHIDGVIVAFRPTRAYWRESFGKGSVGSPPDCSSADGVRGKGDPGGACESCPLNQFETATREDGSRGRGKACGEFLLLFVLRQNDRLPIVIVAPVTSIKTVRSYMVDLFGAGKKIQAVTTRLGLARTKSKDGINYSVIAPVMVGELDAETAAGIKAYAQAVAPAFARVSVDREAAASR